ncbi:MAG: hypothetical protein EBR33_12710 [Synechococcaceae bacterium WB4_1_0192]|nr:hypothetical protein [Synechococcaceae bacterium WB4_1_0192]
MNPNPTSAAALLRSRPPTVRVKVYPNPNGEPLWVEITRLSPIEHAAAFGLGQAMAGMLSDGRVVPTVSDAMQALERAQTIAQLSVVAIADQPEGGNRFPVKLVRNDDEAVQVPGGVEAVEITSLLSQADVMAIATAAAKLANGAEADRQSLPTFR